MNKYGQTHPLNALGVGAAEESAYRFLLVHPGSTSSELRNALGITQAKAGRLLVFLETNGLVTRTLTSPRKYFTSAPDVAITALVRRRSEEVKNALDAIPEYEKQAVAIRKDQKPIVELLPNQESTRQVFEQIPLLAQHEVINIVRPPLAVSRLDLPDTEDRPTQREAQKRNVRLRSVIDSELLTIPGVPQALRDDLAAGEEIKVTQNVPTRMLIADHHIGLITVSPDDPNGPALLLRSHALLTAMHELFEYLWKRATPLPFDDQPLPASSMADPSHHDLTRELHELLAAGMPDKAIVEELGISRRTLVRRLSEWMDELGARSRYQAGWLAARRHSSDPSAKKK